MGGLGGLEGEGMDGAGKGERRKVVVETTVVVKAWVEDCEGDEEEDTLANKGRGRRERKGEELNVPMDVEQKKEREAFISEVGISPTKRGSTDIGFEESPSKRRM